MYKYPCHPLLALTPFTFVRALVTIGVAIASLGPCTCMLAATGGTVVAWGGNESGQSTPCAQNIVSVAAGDYHTLLLKSDGTVVACGTYTPSYPPPYYTNSARPIEVPPGLRDVVAIAAGLNHDVALLADGTVRSWGLSTAATNVPPGLSNVVAIAASDNHTLALKNDGTVVGWGEAGWSVKTPVSIPAGLTNVVAISAGTGDLALKGDGKVVGWGMNTNALALITNGVMISSGWHDRVVIKADGSVDQESWWGSVLSGLQLETLVSSPGYDHHISLALLRDGTVRGWGFNFYASAGAPMVPAGLSGVVAVAAGCGHSVALVGGGPPFITAQPVGRTVVMSGETYFRAQATGVYPLSYQWKCQGLNIPGATRSLLILTNLQPEQAGDYTVEVRNALGTKTSIPASLQLMPLQIDQQPQNQSRFVGDSAHFEVIVRGIEPLQYQWRHNGMDIPGANDRTLILNNVSAADAGQYSVWVANAYGRILSATAELAVYPVLITDQPKDQVSYRGGNASFSVACNGIPPISYQWLHNGSPLPGATNSTLQFTNLISDQAGSYSVLASNVIGQVESAPASLYLPVVVAWGDIPQSTVPPSLTNVLAIASGSYHDEVLTSDRRVIAWNNSYSSNDTNVPPNATNIAAISVGGYYGNSMAINMDGSVVRWGANSRPVPPTTNLVTATQSYGVVGLCADGTMVTSGFSRPPPSNLTDLVSIRVGYEHGVALRSDGTVVAWGLNDYGQATVTPTATNVVAISAEYNSSMALRADGTVVAWGYDWQGKTNVPAGLTNVVRIAGGHYHSMALKADGTVVVWGDNWAGQTNIPPGLTNVIAIAAAGRHCLALLGDGPPVLHAEAFNPVLTNGTLSLSIPTESGRVYRLEYATSPGEASWTPLTLKLGTGEPIELIDPAPSTAQRFYRVRDW